MNIALLLLSTLTALPAFAQVKESPKVYIRVADDCGYCGNHDYQMKTCTIDTEGTVEIVDKKLKHQERTWTYSISGEEMAELKTLAESAQTAPVVSHYQDYSGDAPSFRISAYPDGLSRLKIEAYASGVYYLDSEDAKKLARKSARICHMSARRRLWKSILRYVR